MIRRGELGGVLLRGVYDPDALALLNQRLSSPDLTLPSVRFPGFDDDDTSPFLYGRSLIDTPPDLEAYFRDAALFRAGLEDLFSDLPAFCPRLETLLSALGDGVSARLARGPDDTPYSPATIRELPDGHAIGLHIGNAFLCMPQSVQLGRAVEVGAQLSYFMPLQLPEGGGELVIYNLRWETVAEQYQQGGVEIKQLPAIVERFAELCPQVRYTPGAGDMMVFDGGRYYHRVTPVEGARPRRTLGGFLAWSRDGDGVRYWS